MWACGAAGSALPWHGRGRRFDPDQVHQSNQSFTSLPETLHCTITAHKTAHKSDGGTGVSLKIRLAQSGLKCRIRIQRHGDRNGKQSTQRIIVRGSCSWFRLGVHNLTTHPLKTHAAVPVVAAKICCDPICIPGHPCRVE
jgi:hypothetical protein